MSWQIQQVAQDAIQPLFNSDGGSNAFNILDFFVPKSRQGSIQPGGIKRFFTGFTQQDAPQGGGMQIMGTVQTLMKGIHTVVQVISGLGNQISVLLKNTTDKTVHIGNGTHICRSVLKTVFTIIPKILPLVAESNKQNIEILQQTQPIKSKKIKKWSFGDANKSKLQRR